MNEVVEVNEVIEAFEVNEVFEVFEVIEVIHVHVRSIVTPERTYIGPLQIR